MFSGNGYPKGRHVPDWSDIEVPLSPRGKMAPQGVVSSKNSKAGCLSGEVSKAGDH